MGISQITEAVESIPTVSVKPVIRETLKHECVSWDLGPDGISLEGNHESTSLTASEPASPGELFKKRYTKGETHSPPRQGTALSKYLTEKQTANLTTAKL